MDGEETFPEEREVLLLEEGGKLCPLDAGRER